MKRLSGFSLMEMMTVLLIVSIVAAATAPMINKKMMASRNIEAGAGGGGGCHWQDVGNGNIAFNSDANKVTAIIGDNSYDSKNSTPRMYIKSDRKTPFIDFEIPETTGFESTRFSLFSNGSNIGITSGEVANNSIAIGNSATAKGYCSVAIGAKNSYTNNYSHSIILRVLCTVN